MKKNHSQIDPKTGLNILRGHISYAGQDCCQISIYCPYCHRNHVHGWPSRTEDSNHLEHRSCHCHDTRHRSRKDSPYVDHGYLIGIKPQPQTRRQGI